MLLTTITIRQPIKRNYFTTALEITYKQVSKITLNLYQQNKLYFMLQ